MNGRRRGGKGGGAHTSRAKSMGFRRTSIMSEMILKLSRILWLAMFVSVVSSFSSQIEINSCRILVGDGAFQSKTTAISRERRTNLVISLVWALSNFVMVSWRSRTSNSEDL